MLSIRHDRSICESVLRELHNYAERQKNLECRAARGIRYRVTRVEATTFHRWNHASRSWRLLRLRMNGHLSKWTFSGQSRALAAWRAEAARLATIGRGLHRLVSVRARRYHAAPFSSWVDFLNLQTHRKNVLTRIVLRVQDRGLAAALRAWSEAVRAAAGLAVQEQHLALRHGSVAQARALRAWQRVRQRGLRAISMIDSATRRWAAGLSAAALRALHDSARRGRLHRTRAATIAAGRDRNMGRSAVREWRALVDDRRRLRTAGRVLFRRATRSARSAALDDWSAAAREARSSRNRQGRARRRIGALVLGAALWSWAAAAARARVLRAAVRRARAQRSARLLGDCFETWTFGNGLATRILALHERAVGRRRRSLLSAALSCWHGRAALERSTRETAALAAAQGREAGIRRASTALRLWLQRTRDASRLLLAMRAAERILTSRMAFRCWAAAVREYAMQAGRFRHILACAAARRVRVVLWAWGDKHALARSFGRRLLRAMREWEGRLARAALSAWRGAAGLRRTLRAAFGRVHVRIATGTAHLTLVMWGAEAARRSRLRRRGARLAMDTIRAEQSAALQAWIECVVEGRVLENRLFRLAALQAERRAGLCLRAWRNVLDCLAQRHRGVIRSANKIANAATARNFQAWADFLQEMGTKEHGLAKRLVQLDRAAARVALEAWAAAACLLCDLRNLRDRCVTHLTKHTTVDAFGGWTYVVLGRRALVAKQRAIASKRLRGSAGLVLAKWRAQARNARKLRTGLGKLILYQTDRSLVSTFWPWLAFTKHLSRARKGLTAAVLRQNRGQMREILFGWINAHSFGKRANSILLNALGKIGWKRKQISFSIWVTRLRTVQNDKVLFQRRAEKREVMLIAEFFSFWRYASSVGNYQSRRVLHFVLCREQAIVDNVIDFWTGFVKSEQRKLAGLDRCVLRWMNRTMLKALVLWGEMAVYLKRMRKTEKSLQAKSANTQYTAVLKRLDLSSKKIRRVRAIFAQNKIRLLVALLYEWKSITSSMSRKRRDLKKLIDRMATSVFKIALVGWSEISNFAKNNKFQQIALKRRCAALQAKRTISALVQNMKTSRRFHRQITAFNHRWEMTRLKNSCEHWSQWHQKKMAVKVCIV